MLNKDVDLAIIGAGPAGMAAALKAHKCGLQNILLLERSENMGGLLHQCIHNGFGLHYFKKDLTGPEYAEIFMDQFKSSNIEICLETMVTHLYSDRTLTALNKEYGEFKVTPKSVILAMGCRERTRASLGIPGTRPAGIFTAGLAQKLVNVDGYLPGNKFVILGSGDIGMIMARRLTLEGAEVKAVVEIMPHIGGLIRNEVQCIRDFNIPLLLEHTVTEILGNNRVEGVKVARVSNGKIIKDSEMFIDCDTLLLSVGLIPENELSREAGITLDESTGGPVVNEYLETNVDGVFAAGNVLQVYDLVDNVTIDGEKTGTNSADYINSGFKKRRGEINLVPGNEIRTVCPQKIAGFNHIEITARAKKYIEGVELLVGDNNKTYYRKKYRVLSPNEVIKIPLDVSSIEDTLGGRNLMVYCNTI